MWFPKSMSWWMKQNVRARKPQTNRRRTRSAGLIERLEDRTLLSVTRTLSAGGIVSFVSSDNASDDLRLQVNAAGEIEYSLNGAAFSNDLDSGGGTQTLLMSAATRIIVDMSAGQDTLQVLNSGAGGFFGNSNANFLISYDGGADGDRLILAGGTATSEVYTVGPNPGQGSIDMRTATQYQLIQFVDLDPLNTLSAAAILDSVTSPLTVNAGDAANAINYTASASAGFGAVSVDNFQPIDFSNKATLTINGEAGDDVINLNNSTTPTGLTSIVVNGGDPTASDTLIVNGTAGADAINYSPSATLGAGSVTVNVAPTVNFTTIESLVIDGAGGGDNLTHATPAGTDQITYTPGSASDAGTIATRRAGGGAALVPLTFKQLGALGSVSFTSGAREDILELNGTADSEIFNVNSTADRIQIVKLSSTFVTVALNTAGISEVQLRGLDGDDTFNLAGTLPYSQVLVDSGNPSAGDTLNLTGASGAVTMNLGPQTITGYGGTVSFLGIEEVAANAGANALNVTGTAGNDVVAFSPTTAGAGSFSLVGNNIAYIYSNSSSITANLGGGSGDIVQVLGTGVGDTITSPTASSVAVNGSAVTVGTGVESLEIYGLDGDDAITLGLNLAGIPKTVYGGAGNDTVDMTTTVDAIIFGGTGNDTLTGTPLADYISGDEGNDTINGLDGDDTLLGGDDFDIITISGATPGNDTVSGGTGGDWLLFDPTPATTIGLRESAGRLRVDNGASFVLASDISQVIFNSTGASTTMTVHDLTGTTVNRVGVDFNGGGTNTLIVEGSSGDDVISVGRELSPPNGTQVATADLAWGRVTAGVISAAAGDRIVVNGLEGNDTIVAHTSVMSAAVVPGSTGDALVTLNGGSGNDVLTVESPAGQTGNVINGNEGDDAITGGLGDDQFDGGAGDDTFVGGGGTDRVGGGAGASIGDTILVAGTSGADTITLAVDASGYLLATVNGVTTTYTNFLSGPIATSGIEGILVNGLGGDDDVTVDSSNGAIPIAITYNGDAGSDTLTLTGGIASSNTYSVGPDVGSGSSVMVIGGVTQTVQFTGLEPVVDLVGGPLVVNGTNANNAINYSQGSVAANGLVSIDGFETIEFSNKTTLAINAGAGSDTINLNNAVTPTGLTGITVNAGDPTDGDKLVINGRPGLQDQIRLLPTGTGAGTLTQTGRPGIDFTGIEFIDARLDPGASDHLTVDGTVNNDTFYVTTGPNVGQMRYEGTMNAGGGVAFNLPTIDVTGQSNALIGTINFNGVGGTDTMVVRGTGANDTFNLNRSTATSGSIDHDVNGQQTNFIGFANLATVIVEGGDGDDVFNVPSNFPIALQINGGNPSASDTINYNGLGAGLITADYSNGTVAQAGNATTTFTGVEHLNIDGANTAGVRVNGLALVSAFGSDQFTVTPTGDASALIQDAGLNTAINVNNVLSLLIDGNDGVVPTNQLTVVVPNTASTIGVDLDSVDITGLLSVQYIDIQSVVVQGGVGSDTFNVNPTGAPAISIIGGNPIGGTPGDALNITAPAAVTLNAGPTSDAGSVTVGTDVVSYSQIESLGVTLTGAGAAGAVVVNGTNADDDITVIATGANDFTISVNAGPAVVFTDATSLTVNSLSGDDDISLSLVGLTIPVAVSGGQPTAGSDTVVVNGTAGADAVTITPSAADAATVTGVGPAISISATEHLIYSGGGGADAMTLVTPAGNTISYFTPGADANEGSVNLRQAFGGDLLGFSYVNVDGFNGVLNLTSAGDSVNINGTGDNDQFTVTPAGAVRIGTPGALGTPFKSVTINTAGADRLDLLGGNGDDTFNVPANHGYTVGLFVQGGDPSASDILNVDGDNVAAALTVSLTASTVTQAGSPIVNYSGVETLNITGGANAIAVNGVAGQDTLDITPTGANTARLEAAGSNTVINTTNTGTLTVNPGTGVDVITVHGSGDDDAIAVSRGATTTVQVTTQNPAAVALKTISINSGFTQTLVVNAGLGDDLITVTGTGGPNTVAIDGNDPSASDTLAILTGATASVAFGVVPTSGSVTATNGDVSFSNIENLNLTGSGAGTLTVNGTNGDDAINQNGNTVTVNNGSVVNFASYPTLTLAGINGDDTINVRPTTLVGVTTFNVDGGDPTASDTLIVNATGGNDTITYAPSTTIGAGSVAVNAAPIVNLTTIEGVTIDGAGGTDALTNATPAGVDQVIYTPGSGPDAGTIATRGAGGGTARVPLTFQHLGAGGSVNFTSAGGREDVLELNGTQDSDVFDVNQVADRIQITNPTGGFVTVALNTAGINLAELRGLDGDDTFNLAATLPYAGGVLVDAGNPSASDTLNLTGATGAIVEDLADQTVTGYGATVSFLGVEHLNLAGTGGAASLTINGTAGNDDLTYTPTGTAAGTLVRAGQNLETNFSGIAGAFNLNGAGGTDVVTVKGTNVADNIAVDRTASTVQVNVLKTVTISSEAIVVAAGLGQDFIDVTGTGAALTVDGGQPTVGDSLSITSPDAEVTYGTDPSTGTVNDISFLGIEEIILTGDTTGTVTINGTNGNDAINQNENTVTVNNGATVTFADYPTLELNGRNGDDTFNVRPETLVNVTTFNIDGGDPTASDTVIVNATAGNDTITYSPSATLGAGSVAVNAAPVVNFVLTESVIVDGAGGTDDLTVATPTGGDQVTYTPGSASDAGTIAIRRTGPGAALVPLTFKQLGAFGSVSFTSGGGREDFLELNGTANSDIFDVSSVDRIQITNPTGAFVTVELDTLGISSVELRGLNGDDTFNIPGNHPYDQINVDGGSPDSGSDVLNFTGNGGAVEVDLADESITETGFGSVLTTGIETANVNTANGNLNVLGTAGADVVSVSPTGANAATIRQLSSNPSFGTLPVINASNIGTLNVNLLGAADRLVVNATQAGETITADGTAVTVGAFETINYSNTEDLQLIGQSGSDTFNVTPALNTTIFVDGGDPIGVTPGDLLNLFPPAAFVLESGPETDEGGLRGLLMQRVSWDHIEGITISGPGPAKIVGTNGDDDITIIARDSSTHAGADGVQDFTASVNGGIAVLFLNQPTLLIDALAGDDDIVVRAPAPNNAVWNVQLTVAGGTPAAATGDQGDVLEYETPGQQTITYTPGAIPGTGVINDTTLSSSITIAQFLCPVDNLPSSQGSIEKLILDGEGGNDNVTVIGTAGNDNIVQTPGALLDSGSIAVNNLLGVTYEDLGAGATLAINGAGGTDTLIVDGSANNDVFGVLANGNVTNAGHLTVTRTDYENLTLRGQDGDDTFNVAGGATLTNIQIEGGDPTASDVLNYTAAANAATNVDLGAATITQSGPAGATVGLSGVERVNLTSSGGASTLNVTGTAGDDTINVTPTAAGAGSFVRLGLGGSPQFVYTGVGGAFTVNGGSGGFDTLGILGDDAADTVTSTASSVTIKNGTVTLGTGLDYLNIATFGGDDNVTLTGLSIAKTIDAGAGNDFVDLSAAVDATIFGGLGNDILIGSPADDLIYGGSGNDILIGGAGVDHEYGDEGNDRFGDLALGNGVADDAGNDFLFGGDGFDEFVWEPGDGSDTIEGGDVQSDILWFLGSNAGQAFLLDTEAGQPTHANVTLGGATVDTHGVEQINLLAQNGDDTVTVGDLSATEVKAVDIDLGGGADDVIVNGRNIADNLQVSSSAAGLVGIEGLRYDLDISNAAQNDSLTVHGNDGNDSIKANVGVENTIEIIFYGDAGDDYLSADATLFGGIGNDTLVGGVGVDHLFGEEGNDIITGNGSADEIDGGAGIDTVFETRDANFALTNTTLVVGAEGTDTLTSIERAHLVGGVGANNFDIGAFTGRTTIFGDVGSDTLDFSAQTDVLRIDLDLTDEDQTVSPQGRILVLDDVIENVIGTAFNDLINIDIALFDRSVDGGLETAIPPGDRLFVDMLQSNPASTKVPNGKLGSYDGTVNGAGFTGTINYVDIETLVIQNPNGGGGNNNGDIPIDFGAATDYPVGNGPRGVVAADVNGDGILDMIVANRNSSSVSVRFGNGFGNFGAEAVYSSGTTKKDSKRSITVALGDIDNDGDLDIVVTNRKANTVGVLRNNGAGVFTTTTFSTGVGKFGKFPMSVKLGDMNNDGDLDIVTTNASVGKKNGSIAILLGNGAGSFGTANTIQTLGRKPRDLELGDFNGDGNLDVAATNLLSREIVFMAGNGAGGLGAPVSYRVGSQPTSIISADFNGDGILDLAVTCQTVREISVLLGTGQAVGTFSETIGIKYPNTELEISINSTDLNGDGNADLIIANRATNTLSYMLGLGNGTFDTRVDFKVGGVKGRQPVAIAYGDFNGDGAIDLMVANAGTDDVSVLLRNPIV